MRLFLLGYLLTDAKQRCPQPSVNARSRNINSGGKRVIFLNHAEMPLELRWVSVEGKEISLTTIPPGKSESQDTTEGHLFRLYGNEMAGETRQLEILFHEYTVGSSSKAVVPVKSCQGEHKLIETVSDTAFLVHDRDAEFLSLVHDQSAPCLPKGRSDLWSCVYKVSKEEHAARPKHLYGFIEEDAGKKPVGAQFSANVMPKNVPRWTHGPGYLKMNLTANLQKFLTWYDKQPEDAFVTEEVVHGGYLNNDFVDTSRLDLDKHPKMHQAIQNEMQDVLEWWTGMPLLHAATYGVRVYRRGSMLLNHIDRSDTHMASAVLQLRQRADIDGGWPLEVWSENGECNEVYLQPGEMVLYEGGKFLHGRPMRFKGDDFSNVFSHFHPIRWTGPGSPSFQPPWQPPLRPLRKQEL